MGKWLMLPESKVAELIHAGLLHDVGKAKIDNDILNKKEKLSLEEFEEIKKHPIYSYEMIKDIKGLSEDCKKSVLMHHERENKSGYPSGIGGNEMNTYSKIIAIANYYDSITTERAYRKKVTPFEAFSIIQDEIVRGFDIHLVNVFLSNLATCYVGTKVLLSNGKSGEIVYVPPQAIDKPIIAIEGQYIDLSKETNIKIQNLL
jgi:HD-GYP domain-containing protein (c-di-GMP phosphodiesterase class II)